jgi:diacylglycerol O-acyltransferase / wax synthase
MKALSGLDGAFLHLETPETPMHVASLHLFDLPRGYQGDFHADIKRLMRGRLRLAPVFTRKLAPMPLQFANPVWVKEDKIDLDYHVRRVTLPKPGTRAQFEDCAGRLHAELLDRSRPLWQLVIIDGLQSGQAALAEHPGMAELAAAALKHDVGQYIKLVRHLPEVVKTLAGLFGGAPVRGKGALAQNAAFGPKTELNQPITGQRGFAGASIPLDTLKTLAAANDAKLNDVVMALCSGMLRRYLARHGGVPKKPLIAAMPISLREAGNTEYTTQATMAVVNLNTHIADPVKRLVAIRDAAGAVKAVAKRAKALMPTDFPTIGVPWVMHGLATLYGRSGLSKAMPPLANVVISNVPGPQMPLYAAGARMVSYWPMSIVEHGLGLNITVLSYAGSMDFGFTTALNVVGDARELSTALAESLAELQARCAPVPRARSRAARTVA